MEPVAAALDDQVLIRSGIRSHQSHFYLTISGSMPALTPQSGFTLMELITTVVLRGIHNGTALGCFRNLSADAENIQADATWSASSLPADFLLLA